MLLGIREFFKIHHVDKDFDEKFYSNHYPYLKNYHQPFCEKHGIDDRHRLFFHWYYHGEVEKTYKNIKEWQEAEGCIENYDSIKEKQISVVVGCKNRSDILDISIHSWIKHDPIKEIIITDWSSNKSIKYLEKISPKIKIIRIENEKYYNASTPVNIAIKKTKYPVILKLDVDYIINPYENFNSLIDISENEFLSGYTESGKLDNNLGFVKGTTGFLCVYKKHIEKVGYYNESIENYGIEDIDMFQRLEDIGLKRKILKFNKNKISIYHNPHDDNTRVENFKDKNAQCNIEMLKNINLKKKKEGPDFIIAGFQKCGTTALRDVLKTNYPEHIHMPDCVNQECSGNSEIDFFYKHSKTKDLGIEWYESLFDVNKISGEKSPNYTLFPEHSSRQIKRYFPDVKIIFCIRNPVDRAYSAYNHFIQEYPNSKNWSWNYELSFIENFEKFSSLETNGKTSGEYAKTIYRYLKYFDFRKMCFIIQERLSNPDTFQTEINKLVGFLNLPNKKMIFSKSHVRKYSSDLSVSDRNILKNYYKPHNEDLYDLLNYRIKEWEIN